MNILYVEDNPRDADLTLRWMQKRAPQLRVSHRTRTKVGVVGQYRGAFRFHGEDRRRTSGANP